MLRSISDFFYCENYIFLGLFGGLLSIVRLIVIFLKNTVPVIKKSVICNLIKNMHLDLEN